MDAIADTDPSSDSGTTSARSGVVRPAVLTALVIVVSVIPPLERLRVSGFVSDDTAWQVALSTWRPSAGDLILTENTYLLHVPLLVVSNALLPASPWSIFIVALVLHAIGLWLIVDVARRAVAASKGVEVGRLAWSGELLVVGAVAAYQLATPIVRSANAGVATRNLEAGVYPYAIWLGYEFVSGRRRVDGRVQWGLVVAAIALLNLNDPLWAVTVVVPVVVATAGWLGVCVVRGRGLTDRARRAATLATVGVAGLAGWTLLRVMLPLLGVRQQGSGTGVGSVDGAVDRIEVTARGVLDIFGRELRTDPTWAGRLIGAGLVATALAAMAFVVAAAVRPGGSAGDRVALPVLTLVWLGVVSAAYAASSAGSSLVGFRYVIVALPAIGVAVAVAVAHAPTALRWAFAGLASLAIAVPGTAALRRDHDERDQLMLDAARVVEMLADEGYERGYSGYWSSSILTYLSGGAAPVLATVCEGTRSVPHEWLTDMGQFDRARRDPGDRTFVVVDRRTALSLTCPDHVLLQQHDDPTEIRRVGDEFEFWLYPGRDVVAEIATTD